jgi:hypothetical protein
MSFPIESITSAKKCAEQSDIKKNQSQSSDLNSKSATVCKHLPSEILEMIASHLKGTDLNNLSKLPKEFKVAALKSKNVQEMQVVLQELKDLDDVNQENISSVFGVYKNLLAYMNLPRIVAEHPALSPPPGLQAVFIQKATKEFFEMKLQCYTEINAGRETFENIENKYNHLKTNCILEGLDRLESSCRIDPLIIRSWALLFAARGGHLKITQAILEKAQLNSEDIGQAFLQATTYDQLDVMQYLLKFSIPDQYKNAALLGASFRRNLSLIQALCASVKFSEDTLKFAHATASELGYPEIVDFLANIVGP